jgi:hypothetical protein
MRMRKLLVILMWVSVILLYFCGIGQSQEMQVKTGTVIGSGESSFGSKKWLEIKTDDETVYVFRVGRATSFQPKPPKIGERVEVHYKEYKGTWVGYKVIMLK